MWLRQSALLTWPLCSAAIGLICLSDMTGLHACVCFSVCVCLYLKWVIARPPVWIIYKEEKRQRHENNVTKRAPSFWPSEPCCTPTHLLFLSVNPPFSPPFQCSLFSQTISGLRKESVYSAAEACWNHAVFPLAKPTIATPWFAYFPCITRL